MDIAKQKNLYLCALKISLLSIYNSNLTHMKKIVLSLMFVALSTMTFAQQWTSLGKSNPAKPEVNLISSSEQQIVVDFTLGGFSLTRVSTPNGIQQVVSVPNMATMLEAGAPDLPQFPVPVIISDRAEMQVNVTKSAYTDYENVEIAPSKGNFSRQINPDDVPYTYGTMYSQNSFYPAAQAYLETPYIIRDFRGQNIMVRPFAYNPITKTLRVYHHLTLTMNKVSDNGVNQKVSRKATQKMAPEMKATYQHRFINYEACAAKYPFVEDRGEMLIICPDQYMSNMQPLVDWKNQSGRPTTLVSISEAGGNNDNAIKNYIQNIYNDPNHNLEFVLLVGDYADLTPHYYSSDGRSDCWFGQLEGSDNYIEAFIGRFSVESTTDVDTQVNKVIYYERDVNTDVAWGNSGLGIGAIGAGSGHYGEDDYQHIDLIRDTLVHYTYQNVTELHQGGGASASSISQTVNNGVSIINYCNHGSETSWGVANYSTSNVNALTNDNMLPIVWSVACLNGKFNHSQPCFAEAWLRATNNSTGVPTGAIGGMFSWISQPWIPPMYGQDEMVNILCEWVGGDQFNHTMGGASLNGNMNILDMAPSDGGNTYNTWILFGDPSLMVRTDNPTSMNVSCNPPILMLGMTDLEVSTQNTEYGIATLMMDGEVIASGYIQNDVCNLEFAPLNNVGTATLTVMGYNKVTEVIDVMVNPAEGPYITVNSFTPNFAPVNQETTLSMGFKNVGVDPTIGVTTVSLSCEDDRLVLINSEAEFEVLPANETITLDDAFSFIISEGVEDATKFQINVTMTCGDEVWNGKANVTAGQAILNFAGASWAGGFVPGESLTLVANFTNVGHYMATNAVASLSSTSEYVTILNGEAQFSVIEPEGTAACIFAVQIDPSCPETEQIPVEFTIQADGGLTANGSVTLKNSCNVIFNLEDSYGDGWNGNQLVVSFDDGTPSQNLTITSGESASYTLEIANGVHVTLSWISGSWTYECSFTVEYENGDLIYQGNDISGGTLYEFDCNCGSTSTIEDYDPVTNLNVTANVESITLSWEAPAEAINYIISRNGLEIGQTTETTFTDTVMQEMTYNYCVVAQYALGNSLPECVTVTADLGVDENGTQFSIYPNPVSNTLTINGGDSDYIYSMFNSLGQQIVTGTAHGSQQIYVEHMPQGVYFLRLTSGTQVHVERVVIE